MCYKIGMSHFNDQSDPRHTPIEGSTGRPADGMTRTPERRSPPTERVIQILNLLADAPQDRFTLTQAAARLGINKPTCLGILTALTEADFVTRDNAKSYGLGPGLLRIGSAAESGLGAVDLIRPLISELHDQLEISCLLSAVHGTHIVILDRLGPAIPGDHRDLIGDRFPLVPPLGLVNIAWERDSAIAEWLARTPLTPVPPTDTTVRALIAGARDCGYIIERRTDSATTPNMVLSSLLASGLPDPIVEELRRHLPPADWSEFMAMRPNYEATIPVANISAPILDRYGRQKYTLTLMPERREATSSECRDWAAALLRTTEKATRALGGTAR